MNSSGESWVQTENSPLGQRKTPLCPRNSQLRQAITHHDSSDSESGDSCDLEPSETLQTYGTSSADAGSINLENTTLEVSDSKVHFGHSISQQTKINIGKPTSVHVDRRRISYVTCSEQERKVNWGKTVSTGSTIDYQTVEDFIRNRFRMVQITPLPWNTRFNPSLEKIYTSLQLFVSDHHNESANQVTIPIQHLFEYKTNDTGMLGRRASGEFAHRILIEGKPGYGKTTLALKIASDWAAKQDYVSKYNLVFFIRLQDFQGDLRSYIFSEFFPQHEDKGRDEWWNYVKTNLESVLFILDGLDELAPEYRGPIDKLLKGTLLDKASVIVTSRPMSSDANVLCLFNRRFEIYGFGEDETAAFIQNYFEMTQKPDLGVQMIRLMDQSQWHLKSCPLFCTLLCVFYEEEGDRSLSKSTPIYRGIIAWLLRKTSQRINSTRNLVDAWRAVPEIKFERALCHFGCLCLKTLSKGQVQFSADQLKQLPDNSGDFILELGLLIPKKSSPRTVVHQENKFFVPIHKTFIEYLVAIYISKLIDDDLKNQIEVIQFDLPIGQNSRLLIFKFTAGLLGESAGRDMFCHLHAFNLPVAVLFSLLHESGATTENVKILSSTLEEEVLVQSSQVELDGWADILAVPDCSIRTVTFLWNATVDATFHGAAMERFLRAFQSNCSVTYLLMKSSFGFCPDDNLVAKIGTFATQLLKKPQLQHIDLQLAGDEWPAKIVDAFNLSLISVKNTSSLLSVRIHIDLDTNRLMTLSQRLAQCPIIKSVILPKLSCGVEGFQSLACLLPSLQHIAVSLNLTKALPLMPVARECQMGSPEDIHSVLSSLHKEAQQCAGIITSGEKNTRSEYSIRTFIEWIDQAKGRGFFSNHIAEEFLRSRDAGCQHGSVHVNGFHWLFAGIQSAECRLEKLDLTGCYLGVDEYKCLGAAIQKSPCLKELRLVELKSCDEIFPVIINTKLEWLDISSRSIVVSIGSVVQLLWVLSTTKHLLHLSLAGWKFYIQHPKVLEMFHFFMKDYQLQELDLSECRFQFSFPVTSTIKASISNSFKNRMLMKEEKNVKEVWPNLTKLSLGGTIVSHLMGKEFEEISGAQLFFHLETLTNLKDLNLSVTRPSQNPPMDDQATKNFFSIIQQRLGRQLETLTLTGWSMQWERASSTVSALKRSLRNCEKLTCVGFCSVKWSSSTNNNVHWLLDSVVSGCPNLSHLILKGMRLTPLQSFNLGVKISEKWGGNNLLIPMRQSIQTEFVDIVGSLMRAVKKHSRLRVSYIGGSEGSVLIRRKKLHLSRLLTLAPGLVHHHESGSEDDSDLTLAPGQMTFFGATSFR